VIKNNISIIGAGQLGSRYLQGLAASKLNIDIWVVDSSNESLARANARWVEANGVESGHTCRFVSSIRELPESLDLAIVATAADVRAEVVELVAAHCRVRYWVLEKVLAQSLADLDRLTQATKFAEGVWVNMPIRTMDWHKQIGKALDVGRVFEISVRGGDWGLACSTLHYLDLVAFWTRRSLISIDTDGLDRRWHLSKRHGYFEIYGELKAKFSDGLTVLFESLNNSDRRIIEIKSTSGDWLINEVEGMAIGPNGIRLNGRVNLQSEMTAMLVESILELINCELIALPDAVELHRLFLSSLLSHWNQVGNCSDTKLPIT
jgi:hypothetical protein